MFCSKESWQGYFGVIFEEWHKEELLEVDPFLDRAGRKLHEPFKGNPLEGADEAMMASFDTTFPIWDLK